MADLTLLRPAPELGSGLVDLPRPVRPAGRRAVGDVRWLLEGAGWTRLRLGTDALMLALAVVGAVLGAHRAGLQPSRIGLLAVYPALTMLALAVRGMYAQSLRAVALDVVAPVFGATSVAAMTLVASIALLHLAPSSDAILVAREWLFALLFVGTARVLLLRTQRRARCEGMLGAPTLIVGTGSVGAHVARRLQDGPEYGLRAVGYLDAEPAPASADDRRLPVLGAPEDVREVVRSTGAEHVILAFTSAPDRTLISLVRDCTELGVDVSLVPRLFDSVSSHATIEHLGGLPVLRLRPVTRSSPALAFKHGLDYLATAAIMLVLSPLLLALAAAVKLSSAGPVFFLQRRVGRDGKEFNLMKFRTMVGLPDMHGEADAAWAARITGETATATAAPVADRTTRIGRVMRRCSFDELPQLINVLRGEMSLVGPRPERASYVERFEGTIDRYGDRHRMKAGITGWAQVHGLRGETSLADRVEWDNYYIENWSPGLDLRILGLTARAVIRGTS